MAAGFMRSKNIANGPPNKGGGSSAPASQGDTSEPAYRQKALIVERENLAYPKGLIGSDEREGPSPIAGGMLPVVDKSVRKTGAI